MLDSQGVWSMVHSDAVMETGGLETQLQCLIALEEKGDYDNFTIKDNFLSIMIYLFYYQACERRSSGDREVR